jgi:hypothetical protein
MATCKDCLHNEACKAVLDAAGFFSDDIEEILNAIKCPNFADKSRFVELPCKAGDTVWVLNQRLGQVFENTVTGIYIKSESDSVNHVTLRHINKLHAESYRSFAFRQFGRTVFYTKEEAEAKLAERTGEENEKR